MSTTPAVAGLTQKLRTGCGPLYPHLLSGDPWLLIDGPGKAGGCAAAQVSALATVIAYALERGGDRAEIAQRLNGIRCQHSNGALGVLSCPAAVAVALGQGILEDDKGGRP